MRRMLKNAWFVGGGELMLICVEIRQSKSLGLCCFVLVLVSVSRVKNEIMGESSSWCEL